MEIVTLIMTAIKGVSIIANSPVVKSEKYVRLTEVSELLAMLTHLMQAGSEAHAELVVFADSIESIANENRSPTSDEWSNLRKRSDVAHATLQEAKARIIGEEPDPASEVPPGMPID